MTWETLKDTIQVLFSQYVGTGKIINSDDNGFTPSQLALLVNLVHNRVVGYPNEFDFLKETGTVPLTGASSYNLRTLIPGLRSVYQNYGINQYQAHPFMGNSEANITPLEGWTLRGDNLIFTGTLPNSGTATLQYKSKYMVKNAAGTRQQFFLADDDYSVLDDGDINIIVFGVGEYINWKTDSEEQDRKAEVNGWFKEAITNLVLGNKNTNQVTSML